MIEQLSIFDASEEFKITNKVRLIELFAEIGSQAMALRNIGADFETYRVVEFDKYAITSYNAIHGTNFPIMDVTKIHGDDLGICERDKYTYIMTYSFPCTDLSVAGKMLGMAEGSGTRSSLLWEVKRLLDECSSLPQVLLMENVPQVHSKQNIEHFNRWLNYLESLGYKNYWKDMNAKNYGVAQSRNRTFVVSILGNYNYDFPAEIQLTKKMKDYLDDVVNERFYITSDKARDLIDKLVKDNQIHEEEKTGVDLTRKVPKIRNISNTLKAGCRGITKHNQEEIGCIEINGIAPTIDAGISMQHTMLMEKEKVQIKQATKDGYIDCDMGGVIDASYPDSKTRRGRVIENGQVSPALTTESIPNRIEKWTWEIDGKKYYIRIRKLTPKECWRLMGFTDEDFFKAEKVNSNTQLYKQAGNSIVVNCLEEIFRNLF